MSTDGDPHPRAGRTPAAGRRNPAASRTLLDVTVTDGAGRPVRAPGLATWLQAVAPRGARGTLAVALVGDRTIRRMNREFAGVDRATDVLSFPAAQVGPARLPVRAESRRRQGPPIQALGDIAIATGVARRQAREAGHGYATELRVLALHGLLHVLGYDHHGDDGRMARLEARLRRRAGLDHGLIERAGR